MKYLVYFFILIQAFVLHGQLSVQNVNTVEQAVQQLAGDGVVISNVSHFFITGYNDDSPIGVFSDPAQTMGLSGGLLMTTGSAKLARGINDEPGSTQKNSDQTYNSSELNTLVYNEKFKDLCVVEFDVSVSSDLLEFRYVFGSEEYLEYVNEYNDVFGFFISGPGITGQKNIAVVPGTTTPVSINTINNNVNSAYYVNNGDGLSDGFGSTMQYDGYTRPLTARATVTPCQTYHIKLIISDVRDALYDSGVFIEANSFSSQNTPTVQFIYEHPRFSYGVEGCNDLKVKVTRGAYDFTRLNESIDYYYDFQGSATEGVDFSTTLSNGVLTIPAGAASATFDVTIDADNQGEGIEYVDFILTSGCVTFQKKYIERFQIYDEFLYGLSTQVACFAQSSVINSPPRFNDELYWHSSELSCQDCISPSVIQDSSRWYVFDATDPVSKCSTTDSVYVIVWNMSADFEVEKPACFTSEERYFQNNSENADNYVWLFGDGKSSEEFDPIHQYGEWLKEEGEATYEVTLIAQNEKYRCIDTLEKSVTIDEFVFIPNVITPNNDRKNEFFEIQGFVGACWVVNVYDRWGSLVFQAQDYQNDWGGEDLSDGVYFYEISNGNDDYRFKGTLLIVR